MPSVLAKICLLSMRKTVCWRSPGLDPIVLVRELIRKCPHLSEFPAYSNIHSGHRIRNTNSNTLPEAVFGKKNPDARFNDNVSVRMPTFHSVLLL